MRRQGKGEDPGDALDAAMGRRVGARSATTLLASGMKHEGKAEGWDMRYEGFGFESFLVRT